MACLDTCFLLDLMGSGGRRRQTHAAKKLQTLVATGRSVSTTRLCVAELSVGVYRSKDPQAESLKLAELLEDVAILELDETAGLIFGRITAHLQERGCPAGDMDVLIASVALANNQALITDNASHFRNILGLHVESYLPTA